MLCLYSTALVDNEMSWTGKKQPSTHYIKSGLKHRLNLFHYTSMKATKLRNLFSPYG